MCSVPYPTLPVHTHGIPAPLSLYAPFASFKFIVKAGLAQSLPAPVYGIIVAAAAVAVVLVVARLLCVTVVSFRSLSQKSHRLRRPPLLLLLVPLLLRYTTSLPSSPFIGVGLPAVAADQPASLPVSQFTSGIRGGAAQKCSSESVSLWCGVQGARPLVPGAVRRQFSQCRVQ